MTKAIDVREAFRIFPGGSAVALQGLTLQVEQGEIVVVLGPSGSGKTTLLRAISAFEQLSAGSARVLGVEVLALSRSEAARFRARELGLLDQHYARALSPDLTCQHTVALGLELLGRPRAAARDAAAELLGRVGLGDRLRSYPRELSGGEQQRVALCAALAHRPRLLLADEPAGELDTASAAEVYRLVAELVRGQQSSALIVSHDDMAAEIADRIVVVHDGRVVEETRPGAHPARLVVNAPGWIRVPDPLLERLGTPRLLRIEARGDEVVVASDDEGRRNDLRQLRSPPPKAEEAAIVAELRDVARQYVPGQRPVVEGVSHRFESGTLTAVVGRSGSGKTTLLQLLAGLDRPTRGEVIVCGTELGGLSRSATAAVRREHVELVSQEPGLVPHLTARENVELGLAVRGKTGDLGEAAAEALSAVGLAHRLAHRADRLSAGERQRVAIARALAARPVVLLADEPTARLDRENARAVAELLLRLAREVGTAVICATHDAAVVEHADETLAVGTPADPARAGTTVAATAP